MPRPYLLRFERPVIKLTRGLPEWSRYSFASANQRSFKTFDKTEIATQRLSGPPFHIELFEVRVDAPFRIHYEIQERQYFLFFMMEGDFTFTTPEGFYVSYAKSGCFSLVFNASGHYDIALPAGRYTALCIALDHEWLTFFSEDRKELRHFQERTLSKEHDLLPYCRIDRNVARCLKSLYTGVQQGKGSLDGQSRYYISLILEEYDRAVEEKRQNVPWKVKEYLDKRFSDPELSLKVLARELGVRPGSMRSQFISEFRTSPHEYYTSKRVELARRLILNHGLPLSKVFDQVGYNDESALRYEMKQFGKKCNF